MDNLSQLLTECHAVRAGKTLSITDLRARAERTGLSLDRIYLAAEAADVEVVDDGNELKIIPCAY